VHKAPLAQLDPQELLRRLPDQPVLLDPPVHKAPLDQKGIKVILVIGVPQDPLELMALMALKVSKDRLGPPVHKDPLDHKDPQDPPEPG
jgi:hypothetical protein